jgi:ABC-type multidrug transport system fused ATPase/permease subunit
MKSAIQKILFIINKTEKKKLLFLVSLNILISIADIAFLAALLFVINFYTEGNPVGYRSILPVFLLNNNSLSLISIFFLLFLFKNTAGYLAVRWQYKFVYQVASRISVNNLLKYLEGSFTDYVNIDSAVQIRKISQQPIEFCQYILAGSQQIITETVLILLALTAILLFNAKLFVLLFAILLPAILIMAAITKKRLKTVRKHVKITGENTLQYLQESLSGFVESNIYDRNYYFTFRYAKCQQNLNHYLSELQATQAIPARLIEVFAILGLFILIAVNKLLGVHFYTSQLVTLGAFIAAAYKIIPGIVKISNISGQIKTFDFTLDDLVEQQKMKPRKTEYEHLKMIKSVCFNKVCFEQGRQSILYNFNLDIQPGDFLGISGPSGNGKTTVINLLLGFLEPGSGVISINDKTTNMSERYNYHKRISYIKQEPFLLHDSILNNITLGEINYDKERLQEVIAICGLDELIPETSEGLEKIITENGKNISGGQRQRIAIARALFKNTDLIVLDEPFNELDKTAEHSLLRYLKQLTQKGKIIILVSHNQQSLLFCNKIISLNELTVCESDQ